MKKFLFILCLIPLAALAHDGHSHSKEMPLAFKFYIGGMAGGHTVELKEGLLFYTEQNHHRNGKPIQEEVIPVTDKGWADFRLALDKVNIWHWRNEYMNNEAQDGTQWNLTVRYAARSLKTYGSNAYPGRDGVAINDPMPSDAFNAFLAALKALTGKPIH